MSPNFFRYKRTGTLFEKRRTGHASTEFVASLIVFFFLMFFPLLNLMGVALSAGMLCMLSHQIATRASEQLTYADALFAMKSECSRLMATGWANFLQLQPRAGYQKCGSDLYIEASQIGSTNVQSFGPNQPLPTAPNPNDVYEYVASTSFQVKPLIPMSGIPFVSQVPALGQPVEIRWNAARAVEHVAGLASAAFSTKNQTLNFPNLTQLAGQDPPSTFTGNGNGIPDGWRNPGVYGALPPNLTVVGIDVFIVPSNSMTWVNSALNVNPGQFVYIDTHADGLWRTLISDTLRDPSKRFDADGAPAGNNFNQKGPKGGAMAMGNPPTIPPAFMELIGYVGNSPPDLTSILNVHFPQPPLPTPFPGYFVMADNSFTLSPGSGNLKAISNDNWRQDNTGEQVVRAIILQP